MNTCPDCPNDLVCHDQGECLLRPTPETDAEELHEPYLVNELPFCVVRIDFARRLERQRNDARELLASEKSTRNAIIAKGIETERQLAEARAICEELVTDSNAVTLAATVVRLERERDEALHKLEIAMAANSDVERIAKERNEAQKAFAIATDQLVQVQGELRQAREENARLREALENCREDSIELLGERDWWKEEPRCGYQKSYAQTAKNIQIADALLTS